MAVKKSHFISDTCCWGHRAHRRTQRGACAAGFCLYFYTSTTSWDFFWGTDRSTDRRRLLYTSTHSHKPTLSDSDKDFRVVFHREGDRAVKGKCPKSDTWRNLCLHHTAWALCSRLLWDLPWRGFPFHKNTDLSVASQPGRESHFSDWRASGGRRRNFSWRAEQQLDSSTADQVRTTFIF